MPAQSQWYLGGAGSVRGYVGGTAAGDAFWRGRLELATTSPAVRAALFSDVGRAYGASDIHSPTLVSVGASFVEGSFRIDVARALRYHPVWRISIGVDHVL